MTVPSKLSLAVFTCVFWTGMVNVSDWLPIPLLVADCAPIVAIISAACFILTLARTRSALLLTLSIIAVTGNVIRITPDLVATALASPPTSPGATPRLTIVTANLWSRNPDPSGFLHFVEQEHPDILVLQEAYAPWMKYLDRLRPEYQRAAGCALPHECNTVILTRLPFVTDGSIDHPCCVNTTIVLPPSLGSQQVRVIGLHLSRTLDRDLRFSEIQFAIGDGVSFGSSDLLAGDLNALPWSTTIRYLDQTTKLRRVTRFTPSWQTPATRFPVFPIDHIYAGCAWKVQSVRIGPDINSDHYPVVATLSQGRC